MAQVIIDDSIMSFKCCSILTFCFCQLTQFYKPVILYLTVGMFCNNCLKNVYDLPNDKQN